MRPVLALLIALACAAPAQATVKVRMDTGGMHVVTDDLDRVEHVNIGGQTGPEGSIVRWGVTVVECAFFCVDPADSSCRNAPNVSNTVECTRNFAGIEIRTLGGDDVVGIRGTLGEAVVVDVGTGADVVGGRNAVNSPDPTGPWTARLGTGADRYNGSNGADIVDASSGADAINTFSGNDRVDGGANGDDIDPGRGADLVNAGDGNDIVFADFVAGSAEPDNYNGDAGYDTLSYRSRVGAIFVALVATTGGQSGENDGITGFERILGGAGADSILGLDSDGGPGNDTLTGGSGDNAITGGAGADVIRGFGGDDTLDANDATADTRIECGSGNDTALLDLRDPSPVDAAACELIDRRAINEERATVIDAGAARLSGRIATVRMRCPRAVGRRCTGRLSLTVRGGSRATARYAIARGASKAVRVRLSAADARRVRASGRRAAVALSRETGRHGAETVTRRLTIRAR